jgi:hypothetical protein
MTAQTLSQHERNDTDEYRLLSYYLLFKTNQQTEACARKHRCASYAAKCQPKRQPKSANPCPNTVESPSRPLPRAERGLVQSLPKHSGSGGFGDILLRSSRSQKSYRGYATPLT